MSIRLNKIPIYLFIISAATLSCFALNAYTGNSIIYLIFTVLLNALLIIGFTEKRIFFETFIGIFFWLGYWLKFSVRIAFMEGKFVNYVGLNFDYTPEGYDRALIVVSIGVAALLAASIIRRKLFYFYPKSRNGAGLGGLFTIYKQHRNIIWLGFVALFITISVTNVIFGIYQRGLVPRTQLPFQLNGIYSWLLLFGGATLSSLILEFEISMKKNALYPAVTLSLFETFFSNTSMLSRGMILNSGALGIGFFNSLKQHSSAVPRRLIFTFSTIFLVLFSISIILVSVIRNYHFDALTTNLALPEQSDTRASDITPSSQNDRKQNINLGIKEMKRVLETVGVLVLDRFPGIEEAIAVSSYPKLGWELWEKAWREKYSGRGTSFFDKEIVSSPYDGLDLEKFHFISLPGILSFLFYPGSYIFLFLSMSSVGLIGAFIEFAAYKLSGSNLILASLIAQVVAYRFSHFGYVPARSYLLFGTIIISMFLIYYSNKILLLLPKNKEKIFIEE